MRKITMLAIANIRGSKSQAGSLLMFVLIAVMFLNIGLVLYINFSKFFDERAEELNAPHTAILQTEDFTTDEQLVYLEQYPNVTEVEKQDVIAGYGDYYMNGSKTSTPVVFANANEQQSMNPPSLIGDSLPLNDSSIYVPYLMKTAGGYELGDDFQINFTGKELHFIVAGFTEDIMYGALMMSIYRFYVPEEMYVRLSQEFQGSHCHLLSVRMTESGLGLQAELDYSKEFWYSGGSDGVFMFTLSFDTVKEARTFVPTLIALLVVGFSIILLIVSLIVIRFGIIDNIEESMTNIGALKAMGYKSKQIVSSILLQFGSIAVTGGILGIVVSQLLLPVLTRVLESQSALIWSPEFDALLAAASLFFVLLAVLLVTFMAARHIKKLHPLIALRGGLETHSFKKNHVPLDKSRGELSLLLALKQLAQSKKQAFMIALIITIVTFASVAALSLYYNTGVEKDALATAIAGEIPDAAFMVNEPSDTEGVIERLLEWQDVRKVFTYQNTSLLVGEIEVRSTITKNFSQFEGSMLYDGRYPRHSNEIAVGNNLSKATGKKIGDTMAVTRDGRTKDFLITGIMQSFNNGGMTILMTYDGLLPIQSDFVFDQFYVYLNSGTDANDFIKRVIAVEGDIFSSTMTKEMIDAQLGSYGSIFAAIAIAILAVTVLIVVLVLYMVIKTMILCRKRELGIQKAVGFTTLQLMNQIAINYTPIICIGIVLGGIGGYFSLNPLFAALTSSAGIVKVDMPSPLGWTIATCAALTILAYLVSMLIAWRIRKISAYSLISE